MATQKVFKTFRVFSIYVSQDSGKTWTTSTQVYNSLHDAVKMCNECNRTEDIVYIVVPADKTGASFENII